MKTECSKDKITEVVAVVSRFSGKHPTLPVLGTVLCEAKKGSLILKATNLDAGIEMSLPAKTSHEGKIAVPAHVFATTISNIQHKQIFMEEKGGNLIITAGSYKTAIKCLPVDDFPTLPTVTQGETIEASPQQIAEGILAVVYASSVSEIKPELSSVYIFPEHNTLVFVSTDSFRLAEKKIYTKNIKDFGGIILPYKNAIEIAKALEGARGTAKTTFSKHHISFSTDGAYITSRLIEGTFPDYKQIVPKEEKTKVVVLKQDLVQALKITSLFANKFNQLTLKARPDEKIFSIETKNADVGEGEAVVDAALSGEPVELNVNTRYFADCIPHIHADSVEISFNGPGRPIVVRGVGNTQFTYLVMPMNR